MVELHVEILEVVAFLEERSKAAEPLDIGLVEAENEPCASFPNTREAERCNLHALQEVRDQMCGSGEDLARFAGSSKTALAPVCKSRDPFLQGLHARQQPSRQPAIHLVL
jgi:hypothetical protein